MKSKNVSNKQLKSQLKETGCPIDDTTRSESNLDKPDSMPWESEQRFVEILAALPEMIFTLDKEGNFLFTNRSWSEYTGYSQEDAKAITLFDLAYPDDLEAVKERFMEVLKGDSLKDFEFKSKTKDGFNMDIQISLSPMLDSEGNVAAACGIGRDITECKKAEAALRESRDMYWSMVDTADQAGLGIAISQNVGNEEGVLVFANEEVLRITGYTREEIIGKTFQHLFPPENLLEMEDQYRRRQAGEELPSYFERRLLRKDGTTVPVGICVCTTSYKGKVATMGYIVDIAGRKKVEETLRRSKEYFQALIENSYDVTTITNVNGGIDYVSPSIKRSLGYETEEFMGKNPFDLIHPDDLQDCINHFAKAIQTPYYFGYEELRFQHKDGSWRTIEAAASNLLDHPSVAGVVVNFRDITERKKTEEKYRQLIEDMNDGYVVYQDGRIVLANCRFAEIYGYDEVEQVLGQDLFKFIAPESLQEIGENYARIMSGEKEIPERDEVEGIKGDGTRIIIDLNIKSIMYEGKSAFAVIFRDITAHKQAEEALRQSEKRFRAIFDYALDGICLAEVETHQLYTGNEVFCEMLGYNLEDIRKMKVEDVHPEQDLSYVKEQFDRQARGEIKLASDIPMLRKDGSIFYTDVNSSLLTLDDKTYLMGIFRDITERRNMEEKYRQLLEDINDGYAVLQDGIYVFTNQRFCEILKYEPGQLLGKSFAEIMVPDKRKAMVDLYERVLHGEVTPAERFEYEVIKADGTICIVEASARPIQYEGKSAYSIIMRDVTKRKNVEKALIESQELYRSLVETADKAGEGILIAQDIGNLEGVVVFANDEILRITGYSREEFVGTTVQYVIPTDSLMEMMERYKRRQAGEEYPIYFQVSLIRKDGTTVPVEYWVGLMTYQGKVATIAYMRDITERKQSEEMLQKSQEKLQSIIRALPDVLFHISRDGTFLDEPMGQSSILEQYRSISPVKTLYEVLPSKFADGSLRAIEATLDSGTLQVIEHSAPFPPGTNSVYETRIVPFGKDEVLAVSRDITDQKLSEERLRIYQLRLQSLTSQLSQTEERERRRLAADLHDLIGQSLAVIKMKLNAWKEILQSSGNASEMRAVLELLDSTINNTRSLTYDLSPPVLYELGIEAGLESLLEKFHELHAVQYEYKDDGQEKPLEDEVCILLYRCTSELLMNVVKHSKAQLVKLSISREDNQVLITLVDDGVGFTVPETEVRAQGFGLLSIRERLNWIGGSFKLKSRPGGGTHATLKAPLKYTENSTEGLK